jgi:hypothetical protein
MANEKKATETETSEVKKLYVERERYKGKTDDKEYWGYFVSGTIRGRAVKVGLAAPDGGGYEILDIVFIGSETAELVKVPYEMTDDKTGKITSGYTYEAHNIDTETGEVYKAPVKPSRKSDKFLLEMLLAQITVKKTA